jgi:ABC-type amino acid transport substrate-binding protein
MKITILSLFMCMLLAGCTSDDRSDYRQIEKSGILKIGTDATYAPFEFNDDKTGQVTGFDIDLMKAICGELKLKPEFTVVPFSGIIGGLKTNKYDCIISAMTITPERLGVVNFTDPYYKAGQSLAVPLNDSSIKSVLDLKGKRIGAQLGTTGEMMAKTIENAKVVSFDNIGAAFIDMENGHLDAVLNDYPTSRLVIAVRGTAKIVGPLLSNESYGIAVNKADIQLLNALNAALGKVKERGTVDSLNAHWIEGR